MRKIVRAIVDKDSFFELKARFGKVRRHRRSRGSAAAPSASSPTIRCSRAARSTPTRARRSTSFLVLCDSFNIPLVLLVDTPGFAIGTEAERKRAPGKIMNFMNALQLVHACRSSR